MVKVGIFRGPNVDYNVWLQMIVGIRGDCELAQLRDADLIVMVDPKEGEVGKIVAKIDGAPILVLLTLKPSAKLLSASRRVLKEGLERISDVLPAPFGAGAVMDVILKAVE